MNSENNVKDYDFSFLYKYIDIFDSLHCELMTKEQLSGWDRPEVLDEFIDDVFKFSDENNLKNYLYVQRFLYYIHNQEKLNGLTKIDLFYLIVLFYREDAWSYNGTLMKRIKNRDIQVVIERLRELDSKDK